MQEEAREEARRLGVQPSGDQDTTRVALQIVMSCSSRLAGFSNQEVNWKAGGRVHNWRTHVPDEVRVLWPTLSNGGRMCIALMAENEAENEEWE